MTHVLLKVYTAYLRFSEQAGLPLRKIKKTGLIDGDMTTVNLRLTKSQPMWLKLNSDAHAIYTYLQRTILRASRVARKSI